jgi:predicted ribonuclease YlaK
MGSSRINSKKIIMPISNEIFETYRIQERAKEQNKAVRLLAAQGYTIVDLEGNIINKTNYKK